MSLPSLGGGGRELKSDFPFPAGSVVEWTGSERYARRKLAEVMSVTKLVRRVLDMQSGGDKVLLLTTGRCLCCCNCLHRLLQL